MKRKVWAIIIATVMAFTGTCTISFAVDNNNDSTESVQAETTQSTAAETQEVEVIDVDATVDGSTLNVKWEEVENVEYYNVTLDDNKPLNVGSATRYTKSNISPESHTVTVQAISEEDVIATGSAEVASLGVVEEFTAPIIKQKTRIIYEDKNEFNPGVDTIDSYMGDYHTISYGEERQFISDRPMTVTWTPVEGAVKYNVLRKATRYTGNAAPVENEYTAVAKDVVADSKGALSYKDESRTEVYTNPEYAADPSTKKYLLPGDYVYVVEAYDADGKLIAKSNTSSTVTVPNFLTNLRTLVFEVRTKTKTKLYKSRTSSKYYRYVPKGTTGIRIDSRKPYRSYVVMPDGQKGWLIRKNIEAYPYTKNAAERATIKSSSYVTKSAEISVRQYGYEKITSQVNAIDDEAVGIRPMTYYTRDYSDSTKENFVNKTKKFTSSTKYLIWLSKYTQRMNIFYSESKGKNHDWKLVRVAEISTGAYLNYTGGGTYKITGHLKTRNRSDYYYQNLSYYYLKNSIHGPCYLKKGTLKGHMKKAPSHKTSTLGCIRTWPKDAEFVYTLKDKAGKSAWKNTKVYSY